MVAICHPPSVRIGSGGAGGEGRGTCGLEMVSLQGFCCRWKSRRGREGGGKEGIKEGKINFTKWPCSARVCS